VELDHVVIAVADLTAAASVMEASYGLTSIEGGRHPSLGTANRIVPLGAAYLELVAVVDRALAITSEFGSWVAHGSSRSPRPLGWAVRTNDLDAVTSRLDLTAAGGARVARDGRHLRWQLAGVEQAAAQPMLPFFIEWGRETPLPGTAPIAHPAGDVAIHELQLTGDADQLAAWIGEHQIRVNVQPGEPAVTGVVLATPGGEIVLGHDPP
jgi:Glyoxalase-like domain